MSRLLALLAIPLLGACETSVSGLFPVSPFQGDRVDSSTITLRWEPLPEAADPAVTELVYDARLLNARGDLLLQQEDLHVCFWILPNSLEEDKDYHWSVRARFRWQGKRRRTDWTTIPSEADRSPLVPPPPPLYPSFRVVSTPEPATSRTR